MSVFMAKLHGRPDDNQQVESVNYNQSVENIAARTRRIAIGGAKGIFQHIIKSSVKQ